MNVLLRAACAATLVASVAIVTGCGESFRQVATPEPQAGGNSAGFETAVVLNQCPVGVICTDKSDVPTGSVVTVINVAGDTNRGNIPVRSDVGSVTDPVSGTLRTPIAFDAARASVFTANTSSDTASQLSLNVTTAGFPDPTPLKLPDGAAPIAISFQYFGLPYRLEYVVNSGAVIPNCPGTGSLGVISQIPNPVTLSAVICLPPVAPAVSAHPVAAWIYLPDRSTPGVNNVFVLDDQPSGPGNVYVVTVTADNNGVVTSAQVTNSFSVGLHPFKVAQSSDGQFLYVLNQGDNSISIINAQTQAVVGSPVTDQGTLAAPVDMAQIADVSDKFVKSEINHVWVLHADGVVSVFDGTDVSSTQTLTRLTTVDTSVDTSGTRPTNLALLRDGTWAYVGWAGTTTHQVVGIDTSKLSPLHVPSKGATTPITIPQRLVHDQSGNLLETTSYFVTSVAVSRQGNSTQLSKLYATAVTSTTFNYYDQFGTLLTSSPPLDNLFNGTAIFAAADISGGAPGFNHAINTLITIIPAPPQKVTCDPGPRAFDSQKNCPAMIPVLALGRS